MALRTIPEKEPKNIKNKIKQIDQPIPKLPSTLDQYDPELKIEFTFRWSRNLPWDATAVRSIIERELTFIHPLNGRPETEITHIKMTNKSGLEVW